MVSGVHVTDIRQAATRHRENVLIKNEMEKPIRN